MSEKKDKELTENVTEYIKNLVENMKLNDWVDLTAALGCAYMGYRTFNNSWEWGLAGIIGYKLATTMSGGGEIGIRSPLFGVDIPFNSQTAGLVILSMIGIKGIIDAFPKYWEIQDATVTKDESGIVKKVECPEGYQKIYMFGIGWRCMKLPGV